VDYSCGISRSSDIGSSRGSLTCGCLSPQLPPLRTPLAKSRKSQPNPHPKRPTTPFFAALKPSSLAPRQLSCHVPTCLHDAVLRYPKPGGDRSRFR
jgi:hypothetical protein